MGTNEIITNARQLLKERTDSLINDVNHCLNKDYNDTQPAPFSALLYCFSTIDLLGALYEGDASKRANTTAMAKNYMTQIMRYQSEKVELLQEVFRHKIVHLAQPAPATEYRGKIYKWDIKHNTPEVHLKEQSSSDKRGHLIFSVSIKSLLKDVLESVFGADGYLDKLKGSGILQANFLKAYTEFKAYDLIG